MILIMKLDKVHLHRIKIEIQKLRKIGVRFSINLKEAIMITHPINNIKKNMILN
jgi:hypothetical protein